MAFKILFLSHYFYPSIGGIETISELLADSFTEAGHDVHVITWSTAAQPTKIFNFKLIRKPSIQVLFKEHAWADVIFENNPCLRLSWPRFLYNRPSVVVLQTWLAHSSQRRNFYSRIKNFHLKKATKVIAISNAVRRDCWPNAGVIANSYNSADFKLLFDLPRTKDFVFVGRLVSDKGADLAVKALYELIKHPDYEKIGKHFVLSIIGDGPDRSSLEELVMRLNMQNNVDFVGMLRGTELASCLNQHRFMLVPSVWKEPFGIVALEGMACGCLPIVSNGGGLPDAVGSAGLTFERGDLKSLVTTLQHVIGDTQFEQSIRNYTEAHLAKHHPSTISKQYLSVIDSIVRS